MYQGFLIVYIINHNLRFFFDMTYLKYWQNNLLNRMKMTSELNQIKSLWNESMYQGSLYSLQHNLRSFWEKFTWYISKESISYRIQMELNRIKSWIMKSVLMLSPTFHPNSSPRLFLIFISSLSKRRGWTINIMIPAASCLVKVAGGPIWSKQILCRLQTNPWHLNCVEFHRRALSIWCRLVEPFVGLLLFNFSCACLRECKDISVYPSNGISICLMALSKCLWSWRGKINHAGDDFKNEQHQQTLCQQ